MTVPPSFNPAMRLRHLLVSLVVTSTASILRRGPDVANLHDVGAVDLQHAVIAKTKPSPPSPYVMVTALVIWSSTSASSAPSIGAFGLKLVTNASNAIVVGVLSGSTIRKSRTCLAASNTARWSPNR